jgi:hypothetical protein
MINFIWLQVLTFNKSSSGHLNLSSVGQTGRLFRTCFKEHTQDYRHGNHRSNFAKHLIDCQHTLHPIEDSMSILHISKKGKMLNTLEWFHIYKETKNQNQINDRHTISPNAIFDALLSPTRLT